MGCNCKTNKQIADLQNKYGVKNNKETNIKSKIGIIIKNILIFTLLIPIVPIFLLFLIFKHIFSKRPIDINKIFKIKKVEHV